MSLVQKKKWVGILNTQRSLMYGKSSTGKPIYKIHPIGYPDQVYKITYGGQKKGKLVIVFTLISETMAEICHVIGLATPENLSLTLQYRYHIYRKDLKILHEINPLESTIQRVNHTHLHVFSIDPKGCIDIDDAFSFETRGKGTTCETVIGVHIAQPIYYITLENALQRLEVAFSTLYTDNKMIPLWSEDIQRQSSLLRDQDRPAYSLFFTFRGKELVGVEHYPSWIRNRNPTSYEAALCDETIQQFFNFSRGLDKGPDDTHTLVEYWMLKTNLWIGQHFQGIPYRVQSGVPVLPDDMEDEIACVFAQRNRETASYSLESDFHSSLEAHCYCHFTSPIRRGVDALIHYAITYHVTIPWNLERLNELDSLTKKFHRQLQDASAIDQTPEGPTIGYLYEKIAPGQWIVYFKEFQGFLKVKVVDPKLIHLLDPELEAIYEVGKGYPFSLHKKEGYLPREKIFAIPGFSITRSIGGGS